MAVARHAFTERLKGQRSRSRGYENRHGRTAAVAVVLLLPAWDCTLYDCSSSSVTVQYCAQLRRSDLAEAVDINGIQSSPAETDRSCALHH